MDERDAGGYTVTYRREDIAFPVVITALTAVGMVATAFETHQAFWLILAVIAAAATYHNLPLLESGRPVIGANQYGIFIQGFGLIRWRAIERIDLVPTFERGGAFHTLHIVLLTKPESALVVDWRTRPYHRVLMRLPWAMTKPNDISVYLDPLDKPPEDIHRTLLRMWRYYRS
jgi:hypothetical protein